MLVATFWITIPGEVEPYVVFKQRLEAREHQTESLSRFGRVFQKFVPTACPAGLRDADERAIFKRFEFPFHVRSPAVSIPFDEDALVRFDCLHCHLGRGVVHFPFPFDLFPDLKLPTAFGEPEFRCEVRIDHGFENIRDGFADEHSCFCGRHVGKLEIVHFCLSELRRKLAEIVNAQLFFDGRDLINHLFETILADELVLFLLEIFAQSAEFVRCHDLVEGWE
jgi:hypothetical protein